MEDPASQMPEASRLPQDAKKLGLSPLTAPELQFASALRADKPMHKIVAWVALLVILAGIVWTVVSLVIGG